MEENIQDVTLQDVIDEKKDYSSFENYTKKQVTLIGYLLGIKEFHITNPPCDRAYLQKIKGTKEIEIIRALSILRLNFIYAYDKIYREKQTKGPFAQFDKMEQMIDAEALHYLQKQGLDPLQYGVKLSEFTKHIANINQLIEENIDNIHKYIPEWVEWNYIKELFIMPECASGPKGSYYNSKQKAEQINAKIHEIRKDFYNNQNFYPYKTYFNWNEKRRPDDYGNILFNDGKFLKLLYSSHYDKGFLQMNHYNHLTTNERENLLFLTAKGYSIRKIATILRRSPSTVSREIRRNSKKETYSPSLATSLYHNRRKKCHKRYVLDNPELYSVVKRLFIEEQWSPEEISNRLRLENYPFYVS